MNITVHADTYKVTGQHHYTVKAGRGKREARTMDLHSIEITLGNDRRAVYCSEEYGGKILVHGLGCRFSQGAKVWPAMVTYWVESGNVNHLTPAIDKRGHFSLVGYFEDFAEKPVASQHNGA